MTTNKTTTIATAQPQQAEPQTQQRHFPALSALLVIAVGIGLWYYGAAYYSLPLEQRPESPLHKELAPSAPIGLLLGIIGTLMMASILLYPLRKKITWLRRAGNIRHWLSVHIFMGLMGPVLITFHTSFKVGGIVSIAYWSMIITMLSGIFGRYIYGQIPRGASGERLSQINLKKEEKALETQLAQYLAAYPLLLFNNQLLLSSENEGQLSGVKAILAAIFQSLSRPWKLWQLHRLLQKHTDLTRRQNKAVKQLVKRKIILARHLAMIDTMEEIFHHWHVLHRPFVWIMFVVVILHIGVAILFGYAGI